LNHKEEKEHHKKKVLPRNSDILFDAILAIFETTLPAILALSSSLTCCINDGLNGALFSES
jgi:hypothetical protein